MTSYSNFENELLVAAYLTTEDTGEDYLRLREVTDRYHVEYKPHWVMRALQSYIDNGYSDDARHLGGDVLDQSVSLTSSGFRAAEDLISQGVNPAAAIAPSTNVAIPAADRIVSLNHNQMIASEAPVSEVIDALEADNGDPDSPGLRERMLGQLKAGRELIRAGEFRAYLLYDTLVRGLGELVTQYKNASLVALANAVLGAIISQIFQVS